MPFSPTDNDADLGRSLQRGGEGDLSGSACFIEGTFCSDTCFHLLFCTSNCVQKGSVALYLQQAPFYKKS
jgi:hypothetical protein